MLIITVEDFIRSHIPPSTEWYAICRMARHLPHGTPSTTWLAIFRMARYLSNGTSSTEWFVNPSTEWHVIETYQTATFSVDWMPSSIDSPGSLDRRTSPPLDWVWSMYWIPSSLDCVCSRARVSFSIVCEASLD